jgi:hypothetical protein
MNTVDIDTNMNTSSSTRFDSKKDIIYWKVEFIFHILSDKADNHNSSQVQTVLTLDRIPEDEPLYKHFIQEFEKILKHSVGSETRSIMGHFREKTDKANECQLKKNAVTLMKRIPCQSSNPKYYKLDLNQCLRDMLSGLVIVEFPTIEVVLMEDAKCFPLLSEEVESLVCHMEGCKLR